MWVLIASVSGHCILVTFLKHTFRAFTAHCKYSIIAKRPFRSLVRCNRSMVASKFGAEIKLITEFAKWSKCIEILKSPCLL